MFASIARDSREIADDRPVLTRVKRKDKRPAADGNSSCGGTAECVAPAVFDQHSGCEIDCDCRAPSGTHHREQCACTDGHVTGSIISSVIVFRLSSFFISEIS